MAMEVALTISHAHEDVIAGIAYNRAKQEAYTCAEGDRAIKVWDLKSGQLLRTQVVHKGMVTCLAYAPGPKLLFSGSIDGSIGVWTDKGKLLQVTPTGSSIFSLAWGSRQQILVAGGNSVLHIFKVDVQDVLRLKHKHHSAQPTTRQQQQHDGAPAAAAAAASSSSALTGLGGASSDAPQALRRVCPALKGWRPHQRPGSCAALGVWPPAAGRKDAATAAAAAAGQALEDAAPAPLTAAAVAAAGAATAASPAAAAGAATAAAAAVADTGAADAAGAPTAASTAAAAAAEVPTATAAAAGDADSEATGSTHSCSNEAARPVRGGSSSGALGGAAAGGAAAAAGSYGRPREEDYYGVCHTDVVKCIVITDAGKIFTAGCDRAICLYDTDKLDKPRDAFKRVRDAARSAITSLAFDAANNVLLAGSMDGSLSAWSVEGRCVDEFERLSNKPLSVAVLPWLNQWWATGRAARVAVLDPRAPAVITEHVAGPNQLLDHAVQLLYVPPGSDLVMAGTLKRQLVVWQHNPHAAHRVFRGHADWVEGLVVAGGGSADLFEQGFYSFSADGHVCTWELDAEQNCDVYRLVEDAPVARCNVLCLLQLPAQQAVACGCDDGGIRLHYPHGPPAAAPDGCPLPSLLVGHSGKVVALALLPGELLLSAGEDRTLRVWDLRTMKQVHVESDVHDSPLQCLEYCSARCEAAAAALGCKVKVWCFAKPRQPRLLLVLDHAEPPPPAAAAGSADKAAGSPQQQRRQQQQGAGGAADVNAHGRSDMRWLTRSDMPAGSTQAAAAAAAAAGQGAPGLPAIVAEAIAAAREDVPEVTQVRWIGHRACWVTAADDEQLRLWDTAGAKLGSVAYHGGSCRCLFVDDANKLLLAAVADKSVCVFDLAQAPAPTPLARLQGHSDVVSGVGYLPGLDCYVTSSWDDSLALWRRPSAGSGGAAAAAAAAAAALLGGELSVEDSEAQPGAAGAAGGGSRSAPSEYEKAHPLLMPKALTQDPTLALLRAIGVADPPSGGKGPGRCSSNGSGSDRELLLPGDDAAGDAAAAADAPGSLGAKLQELGRRLLEDLEATAAAAGAVPGGISSSRTVRGGALPRVLSSKSMAPGRPKAPAAAGGG